MLWALIPWAGLVLVAAVGHFAMSRVSARRDRQFYAELDKLRDDL
jgi:hypothetical protein